MIRIPSRASRKWSVAHGQDVSADLVGTRAMNFNKTGYAMLASLPIALYTSLQSASFGLLLAIVCDGTTYYFITTQGVWSSSDGATIAQPADSSNQPNIAIGNDGVFFNGELVSSGSNLVKSYASSTWTSRVTGLSTSYPHPLAVFESRNELAVANGNVVTTYNTSYSLQNTLTLPAEFIVTWMRWRQNKLYIGTRNITGGGAKMFIWSGTGSTAQEAYGVQAAWIFSGTEYASSIAVVTSAGQVLRFSGGGFDEIDHFPVYETEYSWLPSSSPASSIGKVASRGMIADGDILYINIDGSVHRNGVDYPGNYLHDQPSGLWNYNPGVGLSHKAGYVYTRYGLFTPASLTSNELQFSANHYAETGDPVFCKTKTGITGVTASQTYFAIKTTETALKLALSPADALAGRVLTLGGTPSSDVFVMNTYDSLGATIDVSPGAVALFTNISFYDIYGLHIMFGGRCQNQADVTVASLMALGLGRNQGTFTTAPIYSANVTELFQKVYEFVRNLDLDTDKVFLKYRTQKKFGLPTPTYTSALGKAIWIDATSFTVESLYKNVCSALVGDEVTIVGGVGAGRSAHITDISISGTVYTFTIDETIPTIVPGYLSEIMIDNWQKAPAVVTNANPTLAEGYAEYGPGVNGSWVQFRLELRGSKRIAVALLQIISEISKKSV